VKQTTQRKPKRKPTEAERQQNRQAVVKAGGWFLHLRQQREERERKQMEAEKK